MGSNLRYIESRLPHLRRLLFKTPREALEGCEAAVVATSDCAVIEELRPPRLLGSSTCMGVLALKSSGCPGYEGIGWAV